jgi:hypothetical protein
MAPQKVDDASNWFTSTVDERIFRGSDYVTKSEDLNKLVKVLKSCLTQPGH